MSSHIHILFIVHFLQLEKKTQLHFNLGTPWVSDFLFSPLGKGAG